MDRPPVVLVLEDHRIDQRDPDAGEVVSKHDKRLRVALVDMPTMSRPLVA